MTLKESWEQCDKSSLEKLFEFLAEVSASEQTAETLKLYEDATKVMNERREERLKVMKLPIGVKVIEQTCSAMPSQWEGVTVEGDPILIRYLRGWLRLDFWGRVAFLEKFGEDNAGVMGWREMAEKLSRMVIISSLPKDA